MHVDVEEIKETLYAFKPDSQCVHAPMVLSVRVVVVINIINLNLEWVTFKSTSIITIGEGYIYLVWSSATFLFDVYLIGWVIVF